MRSLTNHMSLWAVAFILIFSCLAAGCAPLLIAGGAAGGYAVAKDMEDGKLIDSK